MRVYYNEGDFEAMDIFMSKTKIRNRLKKLLNWKTIPKTGTFKFIPEEMDFIKIIIKIREHQIDISSRAKHNDYNFDYDMTLNYKDKTLSVYNLFDNMYYHQAPILTFKYFLLDIDKIDEKVLMGITMKSTSEVIKDISVHDFENEGYFYRLLMEALDITPEFKKTININNINDSDLEDIKSTIDHQLSNEETVIQRFIQGSISDVINKFGKTIIYMTRLKITKKDKNFLIFLDDQEILNMIPNSIYDYNHNISLLYMLIELYLERNVNNVNDLMNAYRLKTAGHDFIKVNNSELYKKIQSYYSQQK